MDLQVDDVADTEQPNDETMKTEHQVTDVQQVDAAQGVAGASDEQRGKEVCYLSVMCLFSVNFCHVNGLATNC